MKRVAEALGVSRSILAQRTGGRSLARGPYVKADDEALLPLGSEPNQGVARAW